MSESPILATKLFVSPLWREFVLRQRLIDQLNAGRQRMLILVSAPAGYGKTTLVSSWLCENQICSAWLSPDEDDSDPIRFFQYLLTALQRMIPTIDGDFAEATIPLDTTPAKYGTILCRFSPNSSSSSSFNETFFGFLAVKRKHHTFLLYVVFSLDEENRIEIFLLSFRRARKWRPSSKVIQFFNTMQQKKTTDFC